LATAIRWATRSRRAGTVWRSAAVGCGVDDQGPQPSVVGAHDVGQDVGVEPVVFVSDRAVAAPQILDLVGRDYVNDQPAARIASTTGPSGRSMPTRATPAASSW
jgi:hypothetical protein